LAMSALESSFTVCLTWCLWALTSQWALCAASVFFTADSVVRRTWWWHSDQACCSQGRSSMDFWVPHELQCFGVLKCGWQAGLFCVAVDAFKHCLFGLPGLCFDFSFGRGRASSFAFSSMLVKRVPA
jgi:hypothetical protein